MSRTIEMPNDLITGKNGKSYYKLDDGTLAFVPKDIAKVWDTCFEVTVGNVLRNTVNQETGEYDGPQVERTEITSFVTFNRQIQKHKFGLELKQIEKNFTLTAEDVLKFANQAV